MASIFVIGSSNTDMVIRTGHLPRPGETVIGGKFFMNAGGKGANQAIAAKRLGGHVFFVAKVGGDIFGETALQNFICEGIDTQFVTKDDAHPSGIALINVDAVGENCISVASGANAFLLSGDIDKAAQQFKKGDWVLVQLETPLQTVIHAIGKAEKAGVNVVLNPAPAQQLTDDCLHHLFAITPNETEASHLTGIHVHDMESAKRAAQFLLNKGVHHVIITLGAQGALFTSANEQFHIPAPKAEVVDTTAAGDCFNGALVVALAEGMNWRDSIQFACTAASISVGKLGAQKSLPLRIEVHV
jgi:ribokinase